MKAMNCQDQENFMRLAKDLQAGDIDFSTTNNSDEHIDVEKLITEKPLLEANSVSSRVITGAARHFDVHKVVIDLDIDAALWETSTPGHHHLIINQQMTWQAYAKLLGALKDAGLIQKGYYNASMERKASWVRTPWTKKEGAQAP